MSDQEDQVVLGKLTLQHQQLQQGRYIQPCKLINIIFLLFPHVRLA